MNKLTNFEDPGWIKPIRWFVQQDQFRICQQCSGNAQALFHAEQYCSSCGWAYQAKQHANGRCLARTIGAEKPEDIATLYLEMQVVDGDQSTKDLCQSACTDHRSTIVIRRDIFHSQLLFSLMCVHCVSVLNYYTCYVQRGLRCSLSIHSFQPLWQVLVGRVSYSIRKVSHRPAGTAKKSRSFPCTTRTIADMTLRGTTSQRFPISHTPCQRQSSNTALKRCPMLYMTLMMENMQRHHYHSQKPLLLSPLYENRISPALNLSPLSLRLPGSGCPGSGFS